MKQRLLLILSVLALASCGSTASSVVSVTGNNGSDAMAASSSEQSDTQSIVIYFSATDHTEGIAKKIQSFTESSIYEILPKEPYTAEDLNYNDSNTRATKEQNDDTARPEIGSEKIDITAYQSVYLGYPIWWGQAPKIMYTFVESYSLKGKTVIPFCTSASSGIGTSATNLAKAADGGDWKEGKRFSSSASDEEVSSWIKSL